MENKTSAAVHAVFALIFVCAMAFCIWLGAFHISDTKERYKNYEQVEAVVVSSEYRTNARKANYYDVTFGYVFDGKVYTCEKKCLSSEPHTVGRHTFGYCDSQKPGHFCLKISYGFGIGMLIGSLFFALLAAGSIMEHLLSDESEKAKAYHRILNGAESLVIGISVAAMADFESYAFIPLVAASALCVFFVALGIKLLNEEKYKYSDY